MLRFRIRLSCLLTGALAVCAALHAESPAPQDAPKQNGSTSSASPAPRYASVEQATRLMQQGKNDEALQLLEGIAAAEPSRRGIVREIGIAYYKKSDFLKAVASFKKALEEDPGDSEAIQLMGLSYYLAGRPAEAIAPLEKVQTWYPSANVDASYILVICYMQTKDYPNCHKAFATIFALPPDAANSS